MYMHAGQKRKAKMLLIVLHGTFCSLICIMLINGLKVLVVFLNTALTTSEKFFDSKRVCVWLVGMGTSLIL